MDVQKLNCPYHNSISPKGTIDVSLLTDHLCSKDQFPSETSQVLNDHCDEVWFCRFSPDGLKLATGSKDGAVIIWDVDPVSCNVRNNPTFHFISLQETLMVRHRRTLEGHGYGVAYMSWSPDGSHLLACGPEDCPEVWVWNMTGEEGLRCKVSHAQEDSLTSCSWHKDGRKFVTAGIRGQFYQFVS